MKIQVHLHTTLRLQTPDGTRDKFTIDLPGGSSIQDVLNCLSIGADPDSLLLVLNGRTAALDQILTEGDIVNLMTAISGG
jgi:sulfur carrier protein ThiS